MYFIKSAEQAGKLPGKQTQKNEGRKPGEDIPRRFFFLRGSARVFLKKIFRVKKEKPVLE